MPVKRKNHGRCKNFAGRTAPIHCNNCYRLVPRDKIIKRFQIKQIIESNIQQDVLAASTIKDAVLPKLYGKIQYCVSCAIHNHLIHVRSHESRKPKAVENTSFKRVMQRKVVKTDKPAEKVQATTTAAKWVLIFRICDDFGLLMIFVFWNLIFWVNELTINLISLNSICIY